MIYFEIVTNSSLRKKGKGILLFSSGEKSNKKAAGREPLWVSIWVVHITN